jgi:uncharacterized protein (TIGR02118 family)
LIEARRKIMAGVKLVVLYPRPTDTEVFDRLYLEEHVPLAARKLTGTTQFVATRVLGSPQGSASPFHRIAEIHFPSREALEACVDSEGGRETLADAVRISSGGPPILLIAEEDTSRFAKTAKS